MSPACPFQPRLSSFLAGQLTAGDEELIENHVDGCVHCQRHLDELTEDSSHAPVLADTNLVEEPLTPRLRRNVAAAYASEVGTYTTVDDENSTKPERPRVEPDWPTIPGYEVTGLLGRGGIGEVYRATDHRLKRAVALKIIRQAASPDERERLQREAFALASFRHPGVVQIYEIGEYGNRPFLALEHVGGGSLSRYLAGKPQPPRAAAKLVATLAETIDQAHRSRLVHRDLKPANVLLSWEHDSRIHDDLNYCRPKVTDFGLVKNMSVESGLTHSRDLLGTPSYMAPEQAGGDPDTVGPACDIWALGAILYELLTGRPPFHGANAIETLMQVRQSEPVAPSRLQPKLPHDLETICLKCLEKSPAQRYATAQELADDLNRFRDGKTIQARPVSPGGRAWRWCRRNPAVSSLAGIAIVLMCALALGGPIAAIREVSLRKEANERALQAEAERSRADESLDLATFALDDTLRQVYEHIGVRPGLLKDFDRVAWTATIPYLEQVVKQEASTTDTRLRKARATRQLARAIADRGELQRADALFQEAITDLVALAESNPTHADIQRGLGLCRLEYGRRLIAQKQTANEGEKELKQALDHLEQLVTKNPDNLDLRDDLANVLGTLGDLTFKEKSRWIESTNYYERAAALRKELSNAFPDKRGYLASEMFVTIALGRVQTDLGEHEKAGQAFQKAHDISRTLTSRHVEDPQFLYLRAATQSSVALSYSKTGRRDEAKVALAEANDIHKRLAATFPTSKQFVFTAVQGLEQSRKLHTDEKNWMAAAQDAQAAFAMLKIYTDAHPNERQAVVDLMIIAKSNGEMLRKAGRREDALGKLRTAQEIGATLTGGATPPDDSIARSVAEVHILTGELLADTQDHEAALQQYQEAVELLTLSDGVPNQRDAIRLLKRTLMLRSKSLMALGRVEDARKAEARAKSITETE